MSFLPFLATVLSAIIARPKTKYVVPNYQAIRDKAEAAGFNPLTALQAGGGQVVNTTNPLIGSAIQEAAAALDQSLSKQSELKRLNDYQMQNRRLQEQVNRLTLRPPVPGIYDRPDGMGASPMSIGGRDDQTVEAAGASRGGVSAGASVSRSADGWLDGVDAAISDRGVDVAEVTSDPGFVMIDGPMGKFPVPSVNGEIPDLSQAMVIALSKKYQEQPDAPVFRSAQGFWSFLNSAFGLANKVWDGAGYLDQKLFFDPLRSVRDNGGDLIWKMGGRPSASKDRWLQPPSGLWSPNGGHR